MKQINNIFSNPLFSNILRLIITAGIVLTTWFIKSIDNRISLAELKHTATIYALEKEFGNGFLYNYYKKLEELKSDEKFKKGE
jgi:hypothetical protein